MSITTYVNYHRRPHVHFLTVAEYNSKFKTNIEAPVGFEHELEGALALARRVTDPNEYIQHDFMAMGRRRGRKSSGRGGAGLSGRSPGKTYKQYSSALKGSSAKRQGSNPSVIRKTARTNQERNKDSHIKPFPVPTKKVKKEKEQKDTRSADNAGNDERETKEDDSDNGATGLKGLGDITIENVKKAVKGKGKDAGGLNLDQIRPFLEKNGEDSDGNRKQLERKLKNLLQNSKEESASSGGANNETNAMDLDDFLDDYNEDVAYEEVDPSDLTTDLAAVDIAAVEDDLDAFLASEDFDSPPMETKTSSPTETAAPQASEPTETAAPQASEPTETAAPQASEPSLTEQIDSYLSTNAQDSETFARDRAHVIHFATGNGSLRSQLMKGRERYMKRLSDFLNGDMAAKVRMMDNKEVLVSALKPNRSSLKKLLQAKPGEPRFCKCD